MGMGTTPAVECPHWIGNTRGAVGVEATGCGMGTTTVTVMGRGKVPWVIRLIGIR